jgi:cell wall-associated NlpC family hydrolase
MKKWVLIAVVPLLGFVLALLGIVVLFSTVGGTAQAAACTISSTSSHVSSPSTTTTSTPVVDPNCGASASATLPGSPVVGNGLPPNYVIPANATTVETVAISYVLAQLGKPYLWGGSGPDEFDCSGLTMMAWAQVGVSLLHYTGDQINEGTAVLSFADISPGDLVLVPGSDGTISNPGHVGMYIGDGLVESAVDVQYGIIVQPYSLFVSGGLSGIRHVG